MKHIDKSFVLCGMLTLVILNTCLQIEIRNYQLGRPLPNKEGGKLRYSAISNEESWREREALRTGDQSLKEGRELTEKEKNIMAQDDLYASRWNSLVSWARDWGMLQYLLAPLTFIWGLYLAGVRKGKKRIAALLYSSIAVVCIIFMSITVYIND